MSGRIFSPFYYERDEEKILSKEIGMNEYDRYVNNLNAMVRRYDRRVEISLMPTEIKYLLHGYQINILRGGNLIHLNSNEIKLLQQLSEDAYQIYPNHSILLDMNRSIRYLSTLMSQEWLQSIIPLILNENQLIYNNYLYDSFLEIDGPYIQLVDLLLSLYKRGSIVTTDEDFISRWELVKGNYDGIYHPSWWNTLVAPDPTRFLINAFNETLEFSNYQEAMKYNYGEYAELVKEKI